MVWGTTEGSEEEPDACGRDEPLRLGTAGRGHAPDAPRAGHAAHGDQTRARILQVALELIADRGFAATSTREIAERLGFTKAALYYHFRTKEDLLAAIVGPALGELAALVEPDGAKSAPMAGRLLVEGYAGLVGRHAELIRVLASDPSVKKSACLRVARSLFERLVPLLAGTDQPDLGQRARVRAALGAVHGVLVHAHPGDDPDADTAIAVEAACAVLGIGAESSEGS